MRPDPIKLAIATALLAACAGCSGSFIRVRGADDVAALDTADRSERTALIVLSGVRVTAKGRRAIGEWLDGLPYDVFFPEFETEGGLEGCVEQLDAFIEANRLREYGRLYAFTYIMGGWTLNLYLKDHELGNLVRVVYDRSPIQEQGPRVTMENLPWLMNMLYGRVVADIRDTPYPPIDEQGREIGLIIESRAMFYMRWHEDQVLASGPLEWEPESFGQAHDDYTYVFLHHDEMYYSFDVVGPELEHFFEHGRFSDGARREPFDKDPFQ